MEECCWVVLAGGVGLAVATAVAIGVTKIVLSVKDKQKVKDKPGDQQGGTPAYKMDSDPPLVEAPPMIVTKVFGTP